MTEYSDYSSSDSEETNNVDEISYIYNQEDIKYNLINQLLSSINEFRQNENPLILDKMTPIIFHKFIEILNPRIN